MEFDFNVNELLGYDDICCVTDKMIPFRNQQETFKENKRNLMHVIDKMGALSAKAQNLRTGITSGTRMLSSGHRLYMLKDSHSNGGKGAVIGILKSGYKKLFLFDNQGIQREVKPLCILDFYIHESRQREGLGRRLFDYMLQLMFDTWQEENVLVQHVAVDRPSYKFLSFLQKHYNLHPVGQQIFNFVIFGGFFNKRPTTSAKKPISHLSTHSTQSESTDSLQVGGLRGLNINPFGGGDKTSSYRVSPNGVGVYSRYSTPSHTPRGASSTHNTPLYQPVASKSFQDSTDSIAVTTPPLLSRDGPPLTYRNEITSLPKTPAINENTKLDQSTDEHAVKKSDTIDPSSSERHKHLAKTEDSEGGSKTIHDVRGSRNKAVHQNSPKIIPDSLKSINAVGDKNSISSANDLSFVAPYIRRARDTSWNIFGVPRTNVQFKSHHSRMS